MSEAAAARRVARPRASPARRREALAGLLWSSPWTLGFLLFTLGPVIASLYLSFNDYTIAGQPKWVGLDNFTRALQGRDPLFWPTLARTFHYALVMVPLGISGALLIAVALNQNLKGMPLYRTFFFLPSLTPAPAAALIWSWLFQPDFGAVNALLRVFHLAGPKWLSDPDTAMTSLIIIALWGSIGGGTMIIFLAGLQSVPQELHEAAQIDGAGRWVRFVRVTLPMISPTVLFNLVIGIVGALQVFTVPFIATNGGPNYATWFFIIHLYQNGFQNFDMGYASALAWIFLVIVLTLTMINVRLSRRWVYYEGETR